MFHAHLVNGQWIAYHGDTAMFTMPGWVPFGTVNRMMADLDRLNPEVPKYAVYKVRKDGTETDYTQCSLWFADREEALNRAQEIYENDPSYRVEVRNNAKA